MPQRGLLVSEVKIEGCLERDPLHASNWGTRNPGARNFHYFYSRIFLPLSSRTLSFNENVHPSHSKITRRRNEETI